MQCTSELCVKSGTGVGVGTDNPTDKLSVAGNVGVSGNLSSTGNISAAGNISVTGNIAAADVCNAAGACLSQMNSFVGAQLLVNGGHTYSDCTVAGGTIVDSDVSLKQCQFNSATCPSGWTQYKNYSKTIPTVCSWAAYFGSWTNTSCNRFGVTSSHDWSNTVREYILCGYAYEPPCYYQVWGSCCGGNEYATITQIGCY